MVYPKKRKKSTHPEKEENVQSPASRSAQSASETESEPFESMVSSRTTHVFDDVEDYAIMMLNLKGEIVSWNKGAVKIEGYQAREIIGKNYRIFYTDEDRGVNLSDKLLNQAKKDGRTTYEGWRLRKDGTRFWGIMTLTALRNVDGSVKGYLKITRDLTDKKIAEDMHSNFIEELKIKNAELAKREERYHRMIAEVVDYAIILLDIDGTVLDWNKGAEKLKGYTPKEIIGKNFRLFYPKESKDENLPGKLLEEATRKGSVVHEGWRVRKDGRRFWGSVAITALHDKDGSVMGFSKVTRDLTERKIAEDKVSNLIEELRQANTRLTESEERYHRMIVEVQDYAIILLDEAGDIQNWNVGAQKIKGYSSDEIIGKNFRIFYTREDQKKRLPDMLLDEARAAGRVSHEGWRVRKDGSKFWGSVVITALHDADGSVIGFSKVTRDLTERKFAEDSLKSSSAQLDLKNKSLERLNQELGSFTNVASHDLKEPLRKIEIFASRIKDVGYRPDKSEEFVGKIVDSAARMRNLIEDLLAYSQISNREFKRQQIDLNKVVTTIKTDLEVLIAEKKAQISFRNLPTIRGVSHQLHQLFLNLIANAIKFARPGTPPVIKIECKVIKGPDIPGSVMNGENQYYHIAVKDNGIGFNNEDAAKIFEPFFRLHSQQAYSGTGLGLAIVKKIVDNHNGIVTTEGKPNVGAVFNIYFPLNGTY